MSLYTPYRGLLVYHGLGSGKTSTSITVIESMRESMKIVVMLPASLEGNFKKEVKEKGPHL